MEFTVDMSSNIEENVKTIFQNIFPEIKNDFDWKKTQEGYENWDSLSHLDLTSQLEEKFNIEFELDEIISISSAEDALNIIKKKRNDSS